MAAWLSGVYPIVRVGKLSDIEIQRVLDLGVAGVQIPQVQSHTHAEDVRRFTKFHPNGARGVCRYVRPADFSLMDKTAYFAAQNQLTTVIHIEGSEGINNFDQIIQVPDIDVVFIGPYDLSQSLGLPGQVDHPAVLAEIEALVGKCRLHDKAVGIFTDSPTASARYKRMGVKYIACAVDVGIFAQACADTVKQLRHL